MSDVGSDCDYRQARDDDEEEDDLVGDATPASSEAEDEDEFEPPVGDEEEENAAPEEAYILVNKVPFLVPYVPDGDLPGRVRDFGGVLEVENETVLGSLSSAKHWPPMTEITPKAIVVVKGIHEDGGTLGARKDQGPWHWYARVKVRGKESDDSKILRSIPRTLVLALIDHFAKSSDMRESKLVTTMQPENENAKSFPPQPNEWQRASGIKSIAAPLPRKRKDEDQDDEDGDKKAKKAKKDEAGPSGASKPAEPPRIVDPKIPKVLASKKAPAKAPAAKPAAGKEKHVPPKPAATSMLTFTKQQKKTDLDDSRAPAPAPAPVPAPTPEPQMAAVDTPVSSTMIEAESPFTRVRKCEVGSKATTHFIWTSDTTFYVCEM